MATLTLDEHHGQFQIRSYTPGHLQINERIFENSVLLTPTQLIEYWAPQTIEEITAASLQPVLELKPDVLLIGTGSKLTFLPIETYGALLNAGIGVEVMDTGAACRTFNALSAEDRNVAAALIIK